MLCEYRSDDLESLHTMKAHFERIFSAVRKDATVEVALVGDRPCAGNVDAKALSALAALCADATVQTLGTEAPSGGSGSTDANIPHSLGIPAICVGVYRGAGTHTREEWVEKSSFVPGLEIAIKLAAKMNENE